MIGDVQFQLIAPKAATLKADRMNFGQMFFGS
jgi:hypothetical protein